MILHWIEFNENEMNTTTFRCISVGHHSLKCVAQFWSLFTVYIFMVYTRLELLWNWCDYHHLFALVVEYTNVCSKCNCRAYTEIRWEYLAFILSKSPNLIRFFSVAKCSMLGLSGKAITVLVSYQNLDNFGVVSYRRTEAAKIIIQTWTETAPNS